VSTSPELATLVLDGSADAGAAARSKIYGLFAEALTYPQGASVIRLLDGDLLAELGEALELSPLDVTVPQAVDFPNSHAAIHELQIVYTELFDVTSGTPKVSLLERRYGDTPEQKLWEQLFGFYAHFGLDFSAGYAAEQPDHLLTELGFMHYLSFIEAGTAGDPDPYRRGQRDFLARHLATWVRALSDNLAAVDEPNPFGAISRLLADVVEADRLYLDARVPTPIETPED
jgi:DMSO reductase family type II enzyme chaperone